MIYILLPMYNEADSLPPLLDRIKKGMERRNYEYEIIAYNDGSTDNTLEVLKKYQSDQPIHLIGEENNLGLGCAFRSLIDEVCTISKNDEDIAVCLDSDNTHNPEHVYAMVNKIRDGFDVAIASRFLKDSRIVGVSAYRNALSYGASILMRILFPVKGVKDYTCGYRAYSINKLKKAKAIFGDKLIEESGFACMAEILIKLRKLELLAVEVPLLLRYDHKEGESKMDIFNTIKRTLIMMSRFIRA